MNKIALSQTITIVATALIISLMWGVYTHLQKKQLDSEYSSIIREKNSEIVYHKNKEGKLIAEKEQAVATIEKFTEFYNDELVQLRKDFNVKDKELRQYIKAEFAANNKGTSSVINNNYYDSATNRTVEARDFSIQDGYLDLSALVLPDRAKWSYSYGDTLSIIGKAKKKWFLGKETYFVDAMFRNPNAKVTSMTNVRIDEFKDKRWVIGAGAAISIDGRLAPGLFVGYSIFKF